MNEKFFVLAALLAVYVLRYWLQWPRRFKTVEELPALPLRVHYFQPVFFQGLSLLFLIFCALVIAKIILGGVDDGRSHLLLLFFVISGICFYLSHRFKEGYKVVLTPIGIDVNGLLVRWDSIQNISFGSAFTAPKGQPFVRAPSAYIQIDYLFDPALLPDRITIAANVTNTTPSGFYNWLQQYHQLYRVTSSEVSAS